MADLITTQNLIALATLTLLEIVLGIDNVIFIAILADRLPESQRDRARSLGIGLAVVSRILLLLSIAWIHATSGAAFRPSRPWILRSRPNLVDWGNVSDRQEHAGDPSQTRR